MFLVEGVATAAFGLVLLLWLPRAPATAWCLSPAERAALAGRRAAERELAERRDPSAGTTGRAPLGRSGFGVRVLHRAPGRPASAACSAWHPAP